ncbi:MAG: alpha-L-fucosidase, partial [Planctomycetes bacterium]|nr:alpha-L-fucosidase [Planctomycetota bacterium]
MNKGDERMRGTTIAFGTVTGALFLLLLLLAGPRCAGPGDPQVSQEPERSAVVTEKDLRMAWWREARFGMFIHWGLYAILAGEWNGQTDYGEWIRHSAQIPIDTYDQLIDRFNPVKFDADAWVKIAEDAGMRYIVITSKHHDGFCLFDSKHTDFDVMSTPFKRDILRELADACHRAGLKICWYHSIMDWHHPDYLPRRGWEDRPAEDADFDRYVAYMKNQLSELVGPYGEIGVLWFDGEWEGTWNHDYGKNLYDHVRSLQPDIIINNRVDKGREGMEGMMKSDDYCGDFGTPEQQIPMRGLPGVDWETCMTMNHHWGYNRFDDGWKSAADLIRKLADIASKVGNFLLNVGPTAEGLIPPESVDRLAAMGRWMKINGEAIHGTGATPFNDQPWGRCTTKPLPGGITRLYLHLFDWPDYGRLVLPGLDNEVDNAWLLADPGRDPLDRFQQGTDWIFTLPPEPPDPIDSVVVVDIHGDPKVIEAPRIVATSSNFVGSTTIRVLTEIPDTEIHYTLDETKPLITSPLYTGPITLDQSATVHAGLFRAGKLLTRAAKREFEKKEPRKSLS